MYEKENRQDEIMDFLRILDTKLNMSLSDTEEVKETLAQLKFQLETIEQRLEEIEIMKQEKKAETRWKREVL